MLAGDGRYSTYRLGLPSYVNLLERHLETNWNSFVGLQSNGGVGVDVGWSACFHRWDRLLFAGLVYKLV